jgi:hypothetical protein
MPEEHQGLQHLEIFQHLHLEAQIYEKARLPRRLRKTL